MKIAISAQEIKPESPVDPRFGRAKYFLVHDDVTGTWDVIDNVQNLQAAQGAGIQSAAAVVNAGCAMVISGHCGPKAFKALTQAAVTVYTVGGGTVLDAVEAFKRGELKIMAAADVEEHW